MNQMYISRKFASFLFAMILSAVFLPAIPVQAQESPPVQEIDGKIIPGEIDVFVIQGLKQGQTLYANRY